jgi:hypothetical protein
MTEGLDAMLERGELERVQPDREGSEEALAEARAHADRELGRRLNSLRSRRNRTEYGRVFISVEDVVDAVEVAKALIDRASRS